MIRRLLEDKGIILARIGSTMPGGGILLAMDDARAARPATEQLAGLGAAGRLLDGTHPPVAPAR